MKTLVIGERVIATSKAFNEFQGTIIGFARGYIQVRDQDDDVFDCDSQEVHSIDGD